MCIYIIYFNYIHLIVFSKPLPLGVFFFSNRPHATVMSCVPV